MPRYKATITAYPVFVEFEADSEDAAAEMAADAFFDNYTLKDTEITEVAKAEEVK